MTDVSDDWADGFDIGHEAGFNEAVALIYSGRAKVDVWHGFEEIDPPPCEACSAKLPPSEYGIHIEKALWAKVAPRPNEGQLGSGVLCMDCIENRLGRVLWPEDVAYTGLYGEWPTMRAARLLGHPVAVLSAGPAPLAEGDEHD